MSGCDNFDFEAPQDEFWFGEGLRGADGTTFYPHVSAEGVLSWTNDGGKPNPAPVNIKGADGKSAYEAAVEAGFSGTESEFNEYLSNIGVLTDEVADQKSAIEALEDLTDRKAGMLVDTASGAIASFVPDSTIDNLLGVSVAVEPVQDLHGQSSPWPAGGGKNKLRNAGATATINGVTFTVASDGTVTANGTASSNATFTVTPTRINLPDGNYILSGCPSGGTGSTYFMAVNSLVGINDYGSGKDFSVTASDSINVIIRVVSGATVNNLVFKPMIRLASVTDATFAPYENICPISGWSAVTVQRTGKNLLENIGAGGTNRGITAVFNDDGTVTLSGTNDGSGYSRFVLNGYFQTKNGVEYTMSGAISSNIVIRNVGAGVSDTGNGINFTGTGSSQVIEIRVFANTAISRSVVVKPMIRPASITDATYEPYQGTTYAIALCQTVYGAKLAIAEDGSVTALVDRAMVDLGSLSWSYSSNQNVMYTTGISDSVKIPASESEIPNIYCSALKPTASSGVAGSAAAIGIHTNGNIRAWYTDCPTTGANFKAAVAGWTLVYELATPIEITLDPVTIPTISGQTNNLWADAGDVSVEYAADLKHYIDSKIAAAVAALS